MPRLAFHLELPEPREGVPSSDALNHVPHDPKRPQACLARSIPATEEDLVKVQDRYYRLLTRAYGREAVDGILAARMPTKAHTRRSPKTEDLHGASEDDDCPWYCPDIFCEWGWCGGDPDPPPPDPDDDSDEPDPDEPDIELCPFCFDIYPDGTVEEAPCEDLPDECRENNV